MKFQKNKINPIPVLLGWYESFKRDPIPVLGFRV